MLRLVFLSLLTGALASGAADGSRAITEAEGVVAIYAETDGPPRMILAAWPDGHVVWSEDRLKGGAPYFVGQVPPARVSAVLSQVEREGAFANRQLANPRFGPDASFTTVFFKKGSSQLKMASWHELAEADGRLVARSHGLTSLANERLLEALRKEPAEYLFYRLVWAELRTLGASLIPSEGHRVNGEVLKRGGTITWREASPK